MVEKKNILVLCKTYPSPSGKYTETSCVAGISEDYKFIRLFPIPYRFLSPKSQFKKWQWIEVQCQKAKHDCRPESYSINIDGIICRDEISTGGHWEKRRKIISKLQYFTSFTDIEKERIEKGKTLALLTGVNIKRLEIKPSKYPEWTQEELNKLRQNEIQAGLFDNNEKSSIKILEKVPFDFYYYYECEKDGKEYKHKIVDWEIGAAYRNWKKLYGDDWEIPFRKKFEEEFSQKDLMFLMGTIHRFPDQWLIISLIYPPKNNTAADLFSCT